MKAHYFFLDHPRASNVTMISHLLLKWLAGLALLIAGASPAFGQQSPADANKTDLSQLQDRRDENAKQIDETERNIRSLENAEYWLQLVEDARTTLSRKQKNGTLTDAEKKTLEAKIEDARANAGVQGTLVDVQAQLRQRQTELVDVRKKKDNVDAEINQLINVEGAKQKFKTSMSITFAVLVGVVIVGFFAISFYDAKVRQEIFYGMSGIQFVTLFSLVIAIILFGITGILEGKELAALLGGLSGYILGRGAAASQGAQKETQPNPEEKPVTEVGKGARAA
jgi:hypothetical protein